MEGETRGRAQLLLRVEIRGGKEARPVVLEQSSRRTARIAGGTPCGWMGTRTRRWRSDCVARDAVEGDRLVAEQDSFLW